MKKSREKTAEGLVEEATGEIAGSDTRNSAKKGGDKKSSFDDRSRRTLPAVFLRMLLDNLVNNAVLLCLLGIHDIVPFYILSDPRKILSSVPRQKFVGQLAQAEEF